MTGRSSKRKGAGGERELVSILAAEMGIPVKRILGQARDGGGDIRIGRYLIEVKRQERIALPAWLAQTEAAARRDGGTPVVAFRTNGQPWRAVIPLADLIQLLRDGLPTTLPEPTDAP